MQTGKIFSNVALLFMVTLLLLLWCSCNPYKQLANRPPLTPKDSAALLARCIKVVSIDTVSPLIPTIIPFVPDSSDYYKQIADSLGKIKLTARDSILLRFKDTCRQTVDYFDNGFKVGYEAGKYEGKQNSAQYYKTELIRADSNCREIVKAEVNKIKLAYALRLTAAENTTGIAVKNADKYRGRMDFWKTWAIIASVLALLFLIICIILWKFRRQAKAANSIINSGEDIIQNTKKLI